MPEAEAVAEAVGMIVPQVVEQEVLEAVETEERIVQDVELQDMQEQLTPVVEAEVQLLQDVKNGKVVNTMDQDHIAQPEVQEL